MSKGNPLFKNREFQQAQRAKVKPESLSTSGKAGYAALVKKGKEHVASKKAAEWRREHPSGLERRVITWLRLLEVPFSREVECGKFWVDFKVQNYAIEVNGEQWHEKCELRPEQKERDKGKYQFLGKAGLTVVILPERDIKSGKAWITLYKLLGEQDCDF